MYNFFLNSSYYFSIVFLLIGLYIIQNSNNRIKKLLGLAIFQLAPMLFFISLGKVYGGTAPVLKCLDYKSCPQIYSNPLPHVLMLTAIVVGITTLAVGLAFVIKIEKEE